MGEQKYSLLRYGLCEVDTSNDIDIVMHVSEKMTCTAAIGGDLDLLFSERFDMTMQGKQRLTLAFIESFTGEEALHAKISCFASAVLDGIEQRETLSVTANALLDANLDCLLNEELGCVSHMSCDMPLTVVSASALQSKAAMAADMQCGFVASEALNSDIIVINLERDVAIVNVTIPAGGKLIIDSDFFTAALNNENVIDLYSGDWITLGRDLLELDVDSGTGGALIGKVIYTERYL